MKARYQDKALRQGTKTRNWYNVSKTSYKDNVLRTYGKSRYDEICYDKVSRQGIATMCYSLINWVKHYEAPLVYLLFFLTWLIERTCDESKNRPTERCQKIIGNSV